MSHFFTFALVLTEAVTAKETGAIVPAMVEGEVARLMDPYYAAQNEDGTWDWHRVGGRWNGVIVGKPESSEDGFNFDSKYESLDKNIRPVKDLLELGEKMPFPHAIVDPSGKWHELGRMGYFGASKGDKTAATWRSEAIEILRQYPDALAVGLDCHI